jgi:hypothetical protein
MTLQKLKEEIGKQIKFAENTIDEGEDESQTFESEDEARGYASGLRWVLREIEKLPG